MKMLETHDLADLQPEMQKYRLNDAESFEFRCHPDVSCFNLCCRNLNLFLNPYDVIRLKQNLNLSSSVFIENYTDIIVRPGHHFPDVLLRMADNAQKTCPFLTAEGCRVYVDRPYTCRAFPVEHGLFYDAKKNHTRLVYFFRPPDFCQGRHEKTSWTPASWEADQKAAFYNQMTIRWAEVARLFQNDPFAGEGLDGQKGKMAFMAAYNVDAFRDFVFNSSFLKRYKVKSSLRMKIKADDTAMLQLGMAWIRMFLFALQDRTIVLKR